jgi:hypothetical protein
LWARLGLILLETITLLATIVPFRVPQSSVPGFQVFCIHGCTWYCCLKIGDSSWHVEVTHCGFNLHLPHDNGTQPFSCAHLHLCYLRWSVFVHLEVFKNWVLRVCLYILDTNSLRVTQFENISVMACSSSFMVTLWRCQFIHFMRGALCPGRNLCLTQVTDLFLKALHTTFRSVIHFQVNFIYGVRWRERFVYSMCINVQVFLTTCWKSILPSLIMPLHIDWKLATFVGLCFWTLSSVPLIWDLPFPWGNVKM